MTISQSQRQLIADSHAVLFIQRYTQPQVKWGVHPIQRMTERGQLWSTHPFLIHESELAEAVQIVTYEAGLGATVGWDKMSDTLKRRILQSSMLPIEFKGDNHGEYLGADKDGADQCFLMSSIGLINFLSAGEPTFNVGFSSVPLDRV
jgi:hypothetical protein